MQWDVHLGQALSVALPFAFGANATASAGDNFKFGADVGMNDLLLDFSWDTRLGFGIHMLDGFYVNTAAVDDEGEEIEELRASIEAYLRLGAEGEPGLNVDASYGFMNAHLHDGVLQRPQLTAVAPIADSSVLTTVSGLSGVLMDYTRNFTLTLTDSYSNVTVHPIAYAGYGRQLFVEFLATLNLELTGALGGMYGSPLPAVIVLENALVTGAFDNLLLGAPVLVFQATNPAIVGMTIAFDTSGDCSPEPSGTDDHCAWGFEKRQHEDSRAQGLGFTPGQTGAGILVADLEAPVNGVLPVAADFTLVVSDTAGITRAPILLTPLTTADVASLDDLVAYLDDTLNEPDGVLPAAGLSYAVAVTATPDNKLQFDCQGHCTELRVAYNALDRSRFSLVFAVDLQDPARASDYAALSTSRMSDAQRAAYRADDARRLTTAEMREALAPNAPANAALPTFQAQLAASAAVRLHVESDMNSLNGFVEQGLGMSEDTLGLPEITYDLKLDAGVTVTFSPADGLNVERDIKMQFDNTTLKLGSLLDYVVKPLASILGNVLGPVLKVVGEGGDIAVSVLNEPVPLLAEIGPSVGLGQPSLLDVADLTGENNKENIIKFLTAFKALTKAMSSLANFMATYDGRPISMGCWEITEKSDLPLPCEVVPLIEGASGAGKLAAAGRMAGEETSALPLADLLAMPEWQSASGGLQIGILQPGEIMNLIMGNDFDIVRYELGSADMGVTMGFGMDFDVLAFNAEFGGGVSLPAFAIGYDSVGLHAIADAARAGADPDYGDLMDGFYVATGVGADEGHDLALYFDGSGYGSVDLIFSTWFCDWGLAAWAELGLGGSFTLDMSDPNGDNKLRLDEMLALTDGFDDPLKMLCLFDAAVNIHGNFDFGGKVCLCACAGFSASDFGLDSVCNFDVSLGLGDILGAVVGCESQGGRAVLMSAAPDGGYRLSASAAQPPSLAQPVYEGCDTILRVNAGPFASQRTFGDTDDNDGVQVSLDAAPNGVQVSALGYTQVYTGAFARVQVIGGAGDDTLSASPALSIPVTLMGMEGNDTLTGGGAADILDGGAGDDTLNGGPGDDALAGGPGADALNGDAGNDLLYGGTFSDTLHGGEGDDTLYGERGDDTLHGDAGNDLLYGGENDDDLYGDDGDDILNGGWGDDTLHGVAGVNRLYGNEGADILYGGPLTDTLHGDGGPDTLYGGDGNDVLDGGSGFDTLWGDAGNDALYGDTGDDDLDGGPGDDLLYGEEGEDLLLDGDGSDALYGGLDADRVGVHTLNGVTWAQGDGGVDTFIYSATVPLATTLTDEALFDAAQPLSPTLYVLMEAISITLGAGDDAFVVDGPSLPFTLTTGDGEDVLTVDALAAPAMLNTGELGHDTVLVHGLQATATVATAGADFDVIAASRARRLNFIQAPLVVDGSGGGTTHLLVSETGETTARAVTLTSPPLGGTDSLTSPPLGGIEGGNILTGLGATGVISYRDLDAFTLALGAGDDAITVTGPAAALTTLDGGFGHNALTLTPLTATVTRTVVTSRTAQVTLDNTADPADAAWALFPDGVVAATTHALTLRAADATQGALALGSGADEVTVWGEPFTMTLDGGAGAADTFVAVQDDPGRRPTPYARLDFGGFETVQVDSRADTTATAWLLDGERLLAQSNELLDLAGRGVEVLRIDAVASNADALAWRDVPNGRVMLHQDAVQATGLALEFSQIETLALTATAGVADTFIMRDVDAPLANVTLDTGDGNDVVSVQKAAPAQPTTVVLGAGQDAVYLRALADGSATSINGAGADDTFRVNAGALHSAVVISGGLGNDALAFDPQGYAAYPAAPPTLAGVITLTGGPAAALTYTGMESVNLLAAAPVLTMPSPVSIGAGQVVTLQVAAASAAGILTYTWDVDGDGLFTDLPFQTAAYTATVTFTVTWSAVQSLGLTRPGDYVIAAQAADDQGRVGEGTMVLTVGGTNRRIANGEWRITNYGLRITLPQSSVLSPQSSVLNILAATYYGPGDGLPVAGQPFTATVWVSGAPTYTYEFSWGDGTPVFSDSNATGVGAATHVYTASGGYTLTVVVSSSVGIVDVALPVKVWPDAPQLRLAGGPSALNEGQTYTLTLAGDGDSRALSYTVSWGDGVVESVVSSTTLMTHTYMDNNDMNIVVAIETANGLFLAANTLNVVVANLAPTLSLTATGAAEEGRPAGFTLGYRDVGDDTLNHWRVDWGDGTVETVLSGITITVHTYLDQGTYAIAATATDEDGTFAVRPFTVTIANVAPTLALAGAVSTTEGAWYTLDLLACADPGRDTMQSWTINWGDQAAKVARQRGPTSMNVGNATTVIAGNNPRQAIHQYLDGPAVYTITLLAAGDEDGTYTSDSQVVVAVSDTPPTVSVRTPSAPVEGAPYTLTLDMIDPGVDVVARWEIAWGDGGHTVIPGALPITGTYTYAEAHAITATRAITGHLYPDDGAYTGTVTLVQAGGLEVTVPLSVVVRNAAPRIALTGEPQPDSGAPFTLTLGPVNDPGDDTVTEYRVFWDDASWFTDTAHSCSEGDAGCAPYETFTSPGTVVHTFRDTKDVHIIRVNLVDEDVADTEAGEYRVAGILPVINRGAVYSAPLALGAMRSVSGVVAAPEDLDMGLLGALDRGEASAEVHELFAGQGISLSAVVTITRSGDAWELVDAITPTAQTYRLVAQLGTPEYLSFAPLALTWGYTLATYSEPAATLLFSVTDVISAHTATSVGVLSDLDRGVVSDALRQVFSDTLAITLAPTATVTPVAAGQHWRVETPGAAYVVIAGQLIHPTGYRAFAPADFMFGYRLNIYNDKAYVVGWGDNFTDTYSIAADSEVFTSPPPTATAPAGITRTLQLNARHAYRQMGVYTVTYLVIPEMGPAWAFHAYPVVVSQGRSYATYLPLAVRNYTAAPDLVVRTLLATPDAITVVIQNQGTAPVRDGFWVQGYLDPQLIPDDVNQIWYQGYANYGATWEVSDAQLPALLPGGVLTLTLANVTPAPYTMLPITLPPGAAFYVQVDAYHPDTTYGAVLELDEILGQSYNNITATVVEAVGKTRR